MGTNKSAILILCYLAIGLWDWLGSARRRRVRIIFVRQLHSQSDSSGFQRLRIIWILAEGRRRTWKSVVLNIIVFMVLVWIVHHG